MDRFRGIRLHPTRGAVVVVLVGMAFLLSSRTTGSGWLTVMVSLAAAILMWGSVGPAILVSRIRIAVGGPSDSMVGRSLDLSLAVEGPPAGYRLQFIEPTASALGVVPPSAGTVKFIPSHRGVLHHITVRVESAAGLGLVWASRTLLVPLASPIDVAPRPIPAGLPKAATTSGEGETAVGGRHNDGETVRTIREYRDGDPLRMIHWASSARRDLLVVKELESPQSPALIVSLDLRSSPDVAEQHASLAAGYIQAGLRSGMPVQLHTIEAAGQHSGWVGSTLEAGRRLARAVPGRVAVPAFEGRATMVHLGPK